MGKYAESCNGFSGGAIALAFLAGFFIGAGTALLLAPEPGIEMRRRLTRCAKTAQEELADVAAETRGALEALTKDAKQTIRQTASRLGDVVEATKDALRADTPALKERKLS